MSLRTRTALLVPALAAATVLVLSACTGGTASAEPSAAATNAGPQRSQQQQQGGPGRGGASGQIASVTGTVMQLRSTDAQTAVTWTDTTTFTSEVAGALSDVTVGTCVVAFAASTSGSSASGSASSDDSTVAATSVRITQPADDGTCTPAFGGRNGGPGGGTRPNGAPTDAATNAPRPSGAPSGAAGQFRMFGGGATGKVTAIDGDTLTVDSTGPDGTTTNRTVTVSSDTTYTRTVAADATAVVVGQCATARGEADDSGKVTATTVTLSAPTDGTCSSGFVFNGGPGGGPGGPGGAGGPQGGQTDTQGGASNA